MIELMALSLFASSAVSVLFIPGFIAIRTDQMGLRIDRYGYGRWIVIFGALVFGAMIGMRLHNEISKVGWSNVDWSNANLPVVLLGYAALIILFPFAGWFFPRIVARRLKDAGWPAWLAYLAVIVPFVNAAIWFALLFPASKLDRDNLGDEAQSLAAGDGVEHLR